jgi:1-deoxy-D-xylulose 5-phosphate reductoisomerase
MKKLAILGSTGSIGHSTLRIVESYPDRETIWKPSSSRLSAGVRELFRLPWKRLPGNSVDGCARPE